MTERDIGGLDVARLSDATVSRYIFVRIDFKSDPPGPIYYTNMAVDYTGDIHEVLNGTESGDHVWTAYDFKIENLSQTQNSILDVSSLSFGNVLGQWSEWLQVYRLREQPIGIYVVWFDVTDGSRLATYQLFGGHVDATRISQRAELSLTPFTTPHSVIVPGGEYSSTCIQIYKDEFCQYAGGLPTCNRTLDDCRAHENVVHFAGFPFLPPPNTTMVWGVTGQVRFQPG